MDTGPTVVTRVLLSTAAQMISLMYKPHCTACPMLLNSLQWKLVKDPALGAGMVKGEQTERERNQGTSPSLIMQLAVSPQRNSADNPGTEGVCQED